MKIKSPTNDCPTCDGLKAKNSYTCMECFKLGKRKRNPHNNGEPSLRHSEELRKKWKEKIEQLKRKRVQGNSS